jgi:hypothetical protein
MRHFWSHDHVRHDFLAVATDEAGQIVSAWVQIDREANVWVPVERMAALRRALARGEIHKNTWGYTDELESSREPVQ